MFLVSPAPFQTHQASHGPAHICLSPRCWGAGTAHVSVIMRCLVAVGQVELVLTDMREHLTTRVPHAADVYLEAVEVLLRKCGMGRQ